MYLMSTHRRWVIGVCVLACTLFGNWAEAQDERTIRAAMARKIDLDLQEVPLQEAIKTIADAVKIKIEIHGPAMEKMRQSPITLNLTGVSAGTCLQTLCELATDKELAYLTMNRGKVLLACRSEAGLFSVTRTYHLAPLVRRITGTVFHVRGVPVHKTDEEAITDVTAMVHNLVAPDAWTENGGTEASAKLRGTEIEVEASWRVHAELEWLLAVFERGMSPEDWRLMLGQRALLEQGKYDFQWDQKPWQDCMKEVLTRGGVQSAFDLEQIAAGGIDVSQPITHKLPGVSPAAALKFLTTAVKTDLGYESIYGEVLMVKPAMEATSLVAVFEITAKSAAGLGVNLQPFALDERQLPAIIDAVQMIAPNSWMEKGGNSGVILVVGSYLTIRQTPQNMWEIAKKFGVQVPPAKPFVPKKLPAAPPATKDRAIRPTTGPSTGPARQ